MIQLKTEKLLAHVDQGIGWLTFNNPERRNAISLEMWQGLGEVLQAFQEDDSVRVVVLKGAGGKAFASGADISEFDQHRANAEQRKQYGEIAERGRAWLGRLDKPLIAMIQGFCIGGGLAVSLSADVRFATTGSTFGIPAAKLGLGYEYAGVAALARLVGPSNARDILFSARFMQAEEALRMGLVNFVVGEDELEARVRSYAAAIARNAPLTVHAAKAAINTFERYSRTDAAEVAALVDACFNSEDYAEGRRAFSEKRPPEFKGR
ncbi:MAG: enoyl-CoA hydratase/isomerase family protein [Cytophagales bacterium]|nr:enoyl-CoA hydratase/isomerase family protein [Rhizobacter sp.]